MVRDEIIEEISKDDLDKLNDNMFKLVTIPSGFYKNGIKVGEWNYFDENGKLEQIIYE